MKRVNILIVVLLLASFVSVAFFAKQLMMEKELDIFSIIPIVLFPYLVYKYRNFNQHKA